MMAMRCLPAVAGIFYPTSPETFTAALARFLLPWQKPQSVNAAVSSHAGMGTQVESPGRCTGAFSVCHELGETAATLVRDMTSVDVSSDPYMVVGRARPCMA